MKNYDFALQELRSLMQKDALEGRDRARLWGLILKANSDYSQIYASRWRPYIEGFPHHLEEPLATVGSVWKLEQVTGLVPLATFELELFQSSPGAELFASLMLKPSLERVSTLAVGFSEASMSCARALTASPHLTHLRSLILKSDFDNGVMEVVVDAPFMRNLNRLEITWSCVEPRELQVLLSSLTNARLEHLDVTGNPLGAEGAELFSQAPGVRRLRTLGMSECGLFDDGVAELAQASTLSDLETLNIGYNEITAAGLKRLIDSPHMSSLRALDLGANPTLSDDGVEMLVTSSWSASLKRLDLGYTGLSDRGALAIASSPHLDQLEALNLCVNGIGDQGAYALANAQSLRNLRELQLGDNAIGPAGIQALVDSPYLSDSVKNQLRAELMG